MYQSFEISALAPKCYLSLNHASFFILISCCLQQGNLSKRAVQFTRNRQLSVYDDFVFQTNQIRNAGHPLKIFGQSVYCQLDISPLIHLYHFAIIVHWEE